ncbi:MULTISPECIES: DUF6234 family protein [unclassified Streptomyces]|uniref:DUF6234 family protein n=1 Tax=unclassified Streptomyces TaxID=2593676 RepID=UPI0036E4D1A7
MDRLPVSPPAFDATTGPRQRRHADRGADIGAGCGLALFELVALVVIFVAWLSTGNAFEPSADPFAPPTVYLAAAGGVGVLAIVAAVIAARSGAIVTVISQIVVAVLISVMALGAVAGRMHDEQRRQFTDSPCRSSPSAPCGNG